MFSVVPLNEVGRLAVVVVKLQDDATTVRLSRTMSAYEYSVANSCDHNSSDRRAQLRM